MTAPKQPEKCTMNSSDIWTVKEMLNERKEDQARICAQHQEREDIKALALRKEFDLYKAAMAKEVEHLNALRQEYTQERDEFFLKETHEIYAKELVDWRRRVDDMMIRVASNSILIVELVEWRKKVDAFLERSGARTQFIVVITGVAAALISALVTILWHQVSTK